jgi:hypothetical protein
VGEKVSILDEDPILRKSLINMSLGLAFGNEDRRLYETYYGLANVFCF